MLLSGDSLHFHYSTNCLKTFLNFVSESIKGNKKYHELLKASARGRMSHDSPKERRFVQEKVQGERRKDDCHIIGWQRKLRDTTHTLLPMWALSHRLHAPDLRFF